MITALLAVLALQLPAPAASSSPSSPSSPSSATMRLDELRQAFSRLDCDRVVQQAPFVFEHRLATPAERHEAGFMHGYCAVVVGNLSEAEGLFSTIVAEDVAAQPPFEIEPRVRVLLEAARGEARKKLEAKAAAARADEIATIVLKVTPPAGIKGGARAFFAIEVDDPRRLVKGLRLEFRRADDMGFYALPVTKLPDGTWRGEIPGTYTRSTNGQTIEWFISAVDSEAEMLTSWGTRAAPRRLVVAPGSSLATDMKAAERLTPELRLGLAFLATPLLTTAGALAGASFLLPVGLLNQPFISFLSAATLPPLGAVLGTSVVAVAILDPADATIAIFSTTVFATISGLFIFSVGVTQDAAVGAIAAGGLGLLASAVVPTALVLLDNPDE